MVVVVVFVVVHVVVDVLLFLFLWFISRIQLHVFGMYIFESLEQSLVASLASYRSIAVANSALTLFI